MAQTKTLYSCAVATKNSNTTTAARKSMHRAFSQGNTERTSSHVLNSTKRHITTCSLWIATPRHATRDKQYSFEPSTRNGLPITKNLAHSSLVPTILRRLARSNDELLHESSRDCCRDVGRTSLIDLVLKAHSYKQGKEQCVTCDHKSVWGWVWFSPRYSAVDYCCK